MQQDVQSNLEKKQEEGSIVRSKFRKIRVHPLHHHHQHLIVPKTFRDGHIDTSRDASISGEPRDRVVEPIKLIAA